MILKGNTRAHGEELARHLMNARNNDSIELAELRGFVASNLSGAFAETEAIASATNCQKYLYSLSINPSEPMSRAQYAEAIEAIEARLGLADQPRAVVFHVKDGREHAHVAWSRIDDDRMQAVHMAFDRQELRELSRQLARRFGHELPKGIARDRGAERQEQRFNEVSMAEAGQAVRSGISPEARREAITDAYQKSDNAAAFRSALNEHGYVLAQGDKRGFVAVDRAGEVHSLTRQIEGARAKDIRAKLKLDGLEGLPSVQQAKEVMAQKLRDVAAESLLDGSREPSGALMAQARLEALRDAQKAEWKAVKGAYAAEQETFRSRMKSLQDEAQQSVKTSYRPNWAELYRQQHQELVQAQAITATPMRRLAAVVTGQAGELVDRQAGKVAGAFNFVFRGKTTLAALEHRQRQDRVRLSQQQKKAFQDTRRPLEDRGRSERGELRANYQDRMRELGRGHDAELDRALQALDGIRESASSPPVRRSFAERVRANIGDEALRKAEREARDHERTSRPGPGSGGRSFKP